MKEDQKRKLVKKAVKQHQINKVKHLESYLRSRANREGVAFDLPTSFFVTAMTNGIRLFFGILIDDNGNLLSDNQEPEKGFLAKWKKNNANSGG